MAEAEPRKRTKRVVVVRRARDADKGAVAGPQGASPGRKRRVVVARQARPGETLQGTPVKSAATATFRYDQRGNLLAHSYLGAEEEDEAEAAAEEAAAQEMMAQQQYSNGTSSRLGLDRAASTRSFLSRSAAGSRRSLHQEEPAGPVDPVAARQAAAEATITNARKTRAKSQKSRAKVLKGLAIHERTALLKEERARKRWEQQQREWQRFKSSMARRLGRDESKLVVSHAEEYREMVEEYDMIQKATPPDQKHGSEYWMMSLRGEGTRYVAIGNIFSGLFCPVKDDDKPLAEVIRRPHRAHRGSGAASATGAGGDKGGHHTSSSDDPKSWRNAPALLRRKRQLRRRIHDLRPHAVDEEATSGLEIVGQDLFDWASRSAGMTAQQAADGAAAAASGAGAGQESKGAGPETNDDGRNGASVAGGTGSAAGGDGDRRGPRLQLQVMSDAATLPGEVGASLGMGNDGDAAATLKGGATTAMLGGTGAAAVRGWPRVLFDVGAGNEGRAVLRLRNVGSTALFFRWHPVNRGGVTASGTTIRPPSADAQRGGVSVAPRGVNRFYCPDMEGMVLPDAHTDFVFTFKSTNAGVFRESWELITTPAANQGMRIRVALRGVSTEQDEGAPARARLEKRLELQSIRHAVEDILYDVIASVKTPRPPPTEDEQREINRRMFEAGNPGLHFSPPVFGDLAHLHARVADFAGAGALEDGTTPTWDGTAASIAAAIDALGVLEADVKAEADAAAAAAAAAEEDAGAGKKGKKKKPAGKKGKKGAAAAEPEPLQLKPLTAAQMAERRRGELRAELGRLCARATRKLPQERMLYSVAREVVMELAEAVPAVAGELRMELQLPLRADKDAEPQGERRAAIEAVLAAKARRARREAAGSDVSSSEEEEESEDDEDSDEEVDEEAAAAAAALAALPPDEQYAKKLEMRVHDAVGEAATRFAALAAAAADETTAAVREACGMALSRKRRVDDDDLDFTGRTVVLRADLNAPTALAAPDAAAGDRVVTAGGAAKAAAAARTIRHLLQAGAATVVVVAHLGAPAGVELVQLPGTAAAPQTSPCDDFTDPARLSLRPYLAALQDALGAGATVGWVEACTPHAVRAAVSSGEHRVILVENVRLVAEECADEAVYALSGAREHLPHASGLPLLDATDVADWRTDQVAVWLHRLCPGVAASAAWACYVDDWADRGMTGKRLLQADAAALALTGVSDAHAPVIAAGIDALRRRAAAEADAASIDAAWDQPKPTETDDGDGEAKGAEGATAAVMEGPSAKDIARRRALNRVTAFRAALSSIGHVFVSDSLEVLHTHNSSVVGVRPRGARVASSDPSSVDGLRVAGLNVADALQAWSRVVEPGVAARPVVAVLGGSDMARRAAAFEQLVAVADTIALGGVLGVAWAKFVAGAQVGATPLPPHAETTVRRLQGLAARRGVEVLCPVDAVTCPTGLDDVLQASAVAVEKRWQKLLAGQKVPPLGAPSEEDEEDEDEDDDDESDIDSDDPDADAKKQARADAKAAKAAAKRAAAAAVRACAVARAATEPSDSGTRVVAVEAEFDGDTSEVVFAEASVPDSDIVVDVGSDTREVFVEAIAAAATVVWTGPLGVVEIADGQGGTREVADAVTDATSSGTTTLLAGDSTVAWIKQFSGGKARVTHAAGGGATLQRLLQGGLLPGAVVLNERSVA